MFDILSLCLDYFQDYWGYNFINMDNFLKNFTEMKFTQQKINHLKVNNSVTLSTHNVVHLPPHPVPKQFQHPKGNHIHRDKIFTPTWEIIYNLHSICTRHWISIFSSYWYLIITHFMLKTV